MRNITPGTLPLSGTGLQVLQIAIAHTLLNLQLVGTSRRILIVHPRIW